MISRNGRLISNRSEEIFRVRDELVQQNADFEIPTLGALKAQLNVTHDEDTLQLDRLRTTAVDFFERISGHHLRSQKREVEFDGPSSAYQIPRTPWQKLNGITKYDEGDSTTLDTSDYYVEEGPPAYVKEKTGTSVTDVTSIQIQYTVGYNSLDDVPGSIQQALRIMVTDLYEYRASAPITGQTLQEVPFDWEDLIAPYQVVTI